MHNNNLKSLCNYTRYCPVGPPPPRRRARPPRQRARSSCVILTKVGRAGPRPATPSSAGLRRGKPASDLLGGPTWGSNCSVTRHSLVLVLLILAITTYSCSGSGRYQLTKEEGNPIFVDTMTGKTWIMGSATDQQEIENYRWISVGIPR